MCGTGRRGNHALKVMLGRGRGKERDEGRRGELKNWKGVKREEDREDRHGMTKEDM